MHENNFKIMAQIKLFDKRKKLIALLVIQSNEATLKITKASAFQR